MSSPFSRTHLGYAQLTSLAASTALTVPAGAQGCFLQCESQNVRFRDDGTAPTASVGFLLKTTDIPFEYTGDPRKLRFIEVAASAKINVIFF